MPSPLRCPRGHEWEDAFDDTPSFVDGQVYCPVCGPNSADKPQYASPSLQALAEDLPRTVQTPFLAAPGGDICLGPVARPTIPGELVQPVVPTPMPTVPGYEILSELGRGGMGVVYKARQLGLNRLVALKMILGGQHAGERQRFRFKAEAEAVARLQHPNIVQIHEVGEQDGHPYFSLEYVEGGTLADRIGQGAFSARAASELLETLARAVHYAHERGIVHRDLKPANILLHSVPALSGEQSGSLSASRGLYDQLAKITDFGLAKNLDRDDSHTRTGVVVGTPQYMAPEQARGKRDQIGPATDIYALGAILYELLAGKPPFDGDSAINVLFRVANEEPPSLRLQRTNTPRDLEIICLKCLHKQPNRRYQSAAELADDLRRFLNHEPILARPVSTWERSVQWVRRRPTLSGLTAGLLVAALSLAAVELRDLHDARLRRAARRAEASELLFKAEGEATERRYDRARDYLDQLGPRLASVEGPDELRSAAERLTAEVKARLAAADTHARFLSLRDEALFQAAPGNRRAAAEKARAALQLVGLSGPDWHPDEAFTAEQAHAVRHGCLELLLVLAEAEEPTGTEIVKEGARGALAVLDRASPLGLRTRAFHLRRADYLRRAGDEGWRNEQKLADACPVESAFDLVLIGREQLSRNQVEEARGSFAAALRKQPADFWAWYYQALCYVRLDNMALARESLSAALSHRENVVWPYLMRGLASGQLHDYKAAEDDFRAALLLLQEHPDPDARYVLLNNRAVVRLGLLARKRKEANVPEEQRRADMRELFELALTDLREAVKLKPEQYHAFVTTGQAYFDSGEPARAVEQINKAIELAEKQAAGRDTLALFYRNRARWEEGTKDLLSPAWRPLLAAVGNALCSVPLWAGTPQRAFPTAAMLGLDSVGAALASLRRAAELETNDAGKAKVLAESGHLNARHQRYAEAVAAYDEALGLKSDLPDVCKVRAECLLKLERWADAAQAFDGLLRSGAAASPKHLAGRALARMKLEPPDRTGAVADLTLALAVEPGNAVYRAQRGQLYLALEQYTAAVADFDEALENDRTAAAMLGRAHARVHLGQHHSAVADAEDALRMKDVSQPQLYAAGTVFALAVGSLDDLRRPLTGEEPAARALYQARALEQVRRSLLALPPAERAGFWRSHPARDRALAPVRTTVGFRQLQRDFAPPDVRASN